MKPGGESTLIAERSRRATPLPDAGRGSLPQPGVTAPSPLLSLSPGPSVNSVRVAPAHKKCRLDSTFSSNPREHTPRYSAGRETQRDSISSPSPNHLQPRGCHYYDMGCRLTRTESTEICDKQGENSPKEKNSDKEKKNGKDSSFAGTPLVKNGGTPQTLAIPNKPIGEVESASQADFFRMLDDKIQNGPDLDSELDD